MEVLDVAVCLRPAGPDTGRPAAQALDDAPELVAGELRAVVREDPLKAPAGPRQIAGHPAHQLGAVLVGRLTGRDELGPGV